MEYWMMLLSIVIGLLGVHYLFRRFNYFKRQGILHIPPTMIFGDMLPFIFRRIAFGDYLKKLYFFKPDAKYFGVYLTSQPVIILRDPDLIKEVFIKNFDAFPSRRGLAEFNDPLFTNNLFSLRGQKWRDMRTLLSPSFTSSKMKTMFTLMTQCAMDFTKSLCEISADKNETNMKDIFTKYTNDVIATCAFGIKVDSMKNPTNDFYVHGKTITDFITKRAVQFLFFRTFPRFARFLGIKFISDDTTNFFKDVVKTTIARRDAENITRPDMIQLMMDIRGKRDNERELSTIEMTAQAFIFFLAGFESSASATCFVAHEIAANPDVQAKLRLEIDEALKNSNGEVTYEVIHRLKYLDAVINEALRMYPPVAFVERICEKACELPPALPGEKAITVKKGQLVWVPIYAIHHDEKYYDNPDKFSPERFLDNNTHQNSPYFIPFGVGPRMCIANRFALLEIKVLVFYLLAQCKLEPCAKTMLPIKLSKKALVMMPENGFWLNVQRRSDVHPTIGSTMCDNGTINS